VGAGSFETQFIFRDSVYENPVGLDMTVSSTRPYPLQWMIPVLQGQIASSEENPHNLNKPRLVLTLPQFPLNVFPELCRLRKLHSFQLSTILSRESKVSISSPRSLFANVLAVNLLGTLNSSGNSLRRAICLYSSRTASVGVMPILCKTRSDAHLVFESIRAWTVAVLFMWIL